MTEESDLQYIKHENIDHNKWNQCIEEAINSRFYVFTGQLDRAAAYWDALVLGDYEYVMPLPFRKKLGIKYLYQPLFSQQLGIYPTPSKKISELFYTYISRNFRFTEINLNAGNIPVKNIEHTTFLPLKNYLLPLGESYKSIETFYSKNTKRNIAKAEKNQLSMVEGIRLESYLDFKLENLPPGVKKEDIDILKSMIAFGQYKGFGEIHGVYSADNDLCAAVYFCRWKDRVIYFNAASNSTGKELGAMYYLVNKFIRKNAGKDLTLDFEGSMIPGVARFYAGFGATPETYFQLKINRLPLFLKLFKR